MNTRLVGTSKTCQANGRERRRVWRLVCHWQTTKHGYCYHGGDVLA